MKSQNRYVSGTNSIPFNPVAYSEILYYLRQCLAHSAGLVPDMENHAAMRDQAPQISKYVKKLLTEYKTEQGPVQTYVAMIKQLLKSVGGLYIHWHFSITPSVLPLFSV